MNMYINNRKNEIISNMKSFSKMEYKKSEVLPELLKLQEEVINLAFNDKHAANSGLKLWNLENHLEKMSNDLEGENAQELEAFKKASFDVCNLIKAEVSGIKGEQKAFKKLESVKTNKVVLKNVELEDDENKTELDAIVLTSKGAFIIEVKNTKKDIFISEDGIYYRMGKYMSKDCEIARKMSLKEKLLKNCIGTSVNCDLPIEKIVVFTNDEIEVTNRCNSLKTTFLNYLPILIEEYPGDNILAPEELSIMEDKINKCRKTDSYPVMKEITIFKETFATALASLEYAASNMENEVDKDLKTEVNKEIRKDSIVERFISKPFAKEIGLALVEVGVSVVMYKLMTRKVA